MPYPDPPTIPAASIVKATFRIFGNGQLGQNVYWYKVGLGAADDLGVELTAWASLANSNYLPLLCSKAKTQDATFVLYLPGGGARTQTFFSAAILSAGTGGSDYLPTQVSGIITRRVVDPGKRNRGRIYVPFPSTTDQSTDEIPTSSYKTRLTTLSTALMPTAAPYISTGGIEWWPGLYRPSNDSFRQLFQTFVHKRWATQRRRGDYGQPNVPNS